MTGEFETSAKGCEWPGCENKGAYRAPQARDRLNDYYWFCLEHVRKYNTSWNYYADLSEEQIEASRKADMTWDRPTWELGKGSAANAEMNGHSDGMAWRRFGFKDPHDLLGDNASLNSAEAKEREKERARFRRLPGNERRAVEILDVADTDSKPVIRAKFKSLVKDLHPDMNGGDRSEEDRLQEVLWAWDQIKTSRRFPD